MAASATGEHAWRRRPGVVAVAVITLVVATMVGCVHSPTRVTLPPAAGIFDYQIGGDYAPADAVQIVDRDRASAPVPGRYNVCYVNAFQTQPGEESNWWLAEHPDLVLTDGWGRPVEDPGWPGEYVLDTSTAARRAGIAAVVDGWIDGCARKGFDAVEPDNLDSWTRDGVDGRLTQADNVALATMLATHAHAKSLAIAQKNTVEIAPIGRSQIGFDFAIAEECEVFHECGGYVQAYGRRVVEVEYTDDGIAAYHRACAARAGQISILLRDRNVTPPGDPAHRSEHC